MSKHQHPEVDRVSRDVYLNMDLLRLLTCGSVDDGKSTLIGRLLHDTKTIFEDQLEAVQQVSLRRGDDRVNLALLTDGLRAEREQGITIDVAYRYFATPKRKFVIADCPGHVQYTRNMVTGASTANLACILVDARKGVIEQTRRHAFICSLLRVPHIVVCVNKMDLVDWSEERFEEIKSEVEDLCARFEVADVRFIPISALHGDNVVQRSDRMDWYSGGSLLHELENIHVASDRDLIDCRFPVQWVIRPQTEAYPDYRGYGGQVAAGVFKIGDEVTALPSGLSSRIQRIEMPGPNGEEQLETAQPPMSVVLHLEDDIDVGRGDMMCRPRNRPEMGQDIDAMIVWMHSEPMHVRKKYSIKHTTNSARCLIKALQYKVDVNTLHRSSAVALEMNEIGRVSMRTTKPLLYDAYRHCRATGGFVVIDETTHLTVGAGMIVGPSHVV